MLVLRIKADEEIVLKTPAGDIVVRHERRGGRYFIAFEADRSIDIQRRRLSGENGPCPRPAPPPTASAPPNVSVWKGLL